MKHRRNKWQLRMMVVDGKLCLLKSSPPSPVCDGAPIWAGKCCTVLWHLVSSAATQLWVGLWPARDGGRISCAQQPMRRLLFILSMHVCATIVNKSLRFCRIDSFRSTGGGGGYFLLLIKCPFFSLSVFVISHFLVLRDMENKNEEWQSIRILQPYFE